MATIEEKTIRWFEEEFPEANCKIEAKDITRLIQSKNGHLYIKLFGVLSDHFVSIGKANEVKEISDFVDVKKRREVLRNEFEKLNKDLRNLLSAIKQEENRLECEARNALKMKTRETFLKSLASTADSVISLCEHFSQLEMPKETKNIFQDTLKKDDLIPKESSLCTRSRAKSKEVEILHLIGEINQSVNYINSVFSELMVQRSDVPRANIDENCTDKLLNHECIDNPDKDHIEESDKSVNSRSVDDLGLAALEIASEYEEQRSAQEARIFDKLDKAISLVTSLTEKKNVTAGTNGENKAKNRNQRS